MSKDKETRKLEAEELEKRAAPLAVYNVDTEATQESTGGDPDTSTSDDGTASRSDGDRTGIVDRTR